MELPNKKWVIKDLLLFSVVVIVLLTTVLSIKSVEKVKKLEQEISEKQTEYKKVKKENLQVEMEMDKREELSGTTEIIKDSEKFNDLFFDWNSWVNYGENMDTLRVDYPIVNSNSIVDISGGIVGNGKSPVSLHDSLYFTTTENKKIINLLKQMKTTSSSETITTWQIVSANQNGVFNIEKMNMYQPLK